MLYYDRFMVHCFDLSELSYIMKTLKIEVSHWMFPYLNLPEMFECYIICVIHSKIYLLEIENKVEKIMIIFESLPFQVVENFKNDT